AQDAGCRAEQPYRGVLSALRQKWLGPLGSARSHPVLSRLLPMVSRPLQRHLGRDGIDAEWRLDGKDRLRRRRPGTVAATLGPANDATLGTGAGDGRILLAGTEALLRSAGGA